MMRLGWIRGFVVLFSGDDVFHEAIPPLVGKVTHGLQDVPKGKFVIMKSGVSEMNLVTVNSNSGFRFDTREATHLICVNSDFRSIEDESNSSVSTHQSTSCVSTPTHPHPHHKESSPSIFLEGKVWVWVSFWGTYAANSVVII